MVIFSGWCIVDGGWRFVIPLNIIFYPPSTIHHPLSTIHYPLSTIHYPPSTVSMAKKTKNSVPPCPQMVLINCLSDVYLGAHWPKSVPPGCPLGAPQENSTTAFAYTRTVVWVYANGCSGIRKRLFGYTQTVVWAYANGNNSVLKSLQLGAFLQL